MTGPDFWTPTCSRGGATRLRPAATMIHMPRTRYACRQTRSVNLPRNLLCPYLITWLRTAPASGRVSATSCVASGRGLRSTQSAAVAFVAADVAPSWPLSPTSSRIRSGTTRSRRSMCWPATTTAAPVRPGHRDPGYRGRVHPGVYHPRPVQIHTVVQQGDSFAKQEQLFSVVQIGPTTLLTVDMDVETKMAIPKPMVKKARSSPAEPRSPHRRPLAVVVVAALTDQRTALALVSRRTCSPSRHPSQQMTCA